MGVEDPGLLVVTCDGCGHSDDFDTTEYAGDPASWGVDISTLEAVGWTRIGDEVLCPTCKEERDDD
jgi:hypothetical protein